MCTAYSERVRERANMIKERVDKRASGREYGCWIYGCVGVQISLTWIHFCWYDTELVCGVVLCVCVCVWPPLNGNVSDKKGFPIYHAPTLLHSHIGIVHATIHNLMGQKRSKILCCTIFWCVPKSHANSGWLYGRSSIGSDRERGRERETATSSPREHTV